MSFRPPQPPIMQRECECCHAIFAIFQGQEYKTLCINCYKVKVKKCAKCKVNNLRVGAPDWQNMCVACFKENREGKYGTCPLCPPERSTHLRRPIGQTMCNACAQQILEEQARTSNPVAQPQLVVPDAEAVVHPPSTPRDIGL